MNHYHRCLRETALHEVAVMVISLAMLFVFIWAGGVAASAHSSVTPVYVTIYSHNEDNWGPVVNPFSDYLKYRAMLLERFDIIEDHGATLNWQSDWPVLVAMNEYEKGPILEETNGKNILRYMVEDLGIHVDPHGHLQDYNYADLAKLIEDLGVKPSGIIGGIEYVREGKTSLVEYVDWQEVLELQDDGYVYGRQFPEYRWKPELLTQPAKTGHWFDDFSSGVWRPGDGEDFYTHSDANPIVYVGQGYPHDRTLLGPAHASGAEVNYQDCGYIKELVGKINSGELPSGKLYTASLHIRDHTVVNDSGQSIIENEALEKVLDELEPYVLRGEVVYADYQTVADLWRDRFDCEPQMVGINSFEGYDSILRTFRQDFDLDDTGPTHTFYFAEGTTRPGFDTYYCIQNPGDEGTTVRITYMKGDGTADYQEVTVPASSRVTVSAADHLGYGDDPSHDFSARVESLEGTDIVAERPVYFQYGSWTGGHIVPGVRMAVTASYFAEGTTRPGFEPYFCLQNPSHTESDILITYMLGDGGIRRQNVTVGPNSRETLSVKDFLGVGDDAYHDFSARIETRSAVSFVAERPMYFDYRGCQGGHNAAGLSAPASAFYLAEGCCRPGFDTYICLQNPSAADAQVLITFMRGDGENLDSTIAVGAGSRTTVCAKDLLGTVDDASHDYSVRVRSANEVNIVVERPVYFDGRGWNGGHDTLQGF